MLQIWGKPKHRIDDIEKCGGTTYCIAGKIRERFILVFLFFATYRKSSSARTESFLDFAKAFDGVPSK